MGMDSQDDGCQEIVTVGIGLHHAERLVSVVPHPISMGWPGVLA